MMTAAHNLKTGWVPRGRSTSFMPAASDQTTQWQSAMYAPAQRQGVVSQNPRRSWHAGTPIASLRSAEGLCKQVVWTSTEQQHRVEIQQPSGSDRACSVYVEACQRLQHTYEFRRQKLGLTRHLTYGRSFCPQPGSSSDSSTPRPYRPRLSSQRSSNSNADTTDDSTRGARHARSQGTPRHPRRSTYLSSTLPTPPRVRTEDSLSTCSTAPDSGDVPILPSGVRRIVPPIRQHGNDWPFKPKEHAFMAAAMLQEPLLNSDRDSSCDLEQHVVDDICSVEADASTSLADKRTLAVLRDWTFSIATDTFLVRCGVILGSLLLGSSVICLLCAASKHGSGMDIASAVLRVAAVLFLLLSIVVLLRLGTPETLQISYVDNDWVITLRRRGLAPESRPIRDLEAFVESFTYCSIMQFGLWFNGIGHPTSEHGTVHLVFARSAAGPAVCMNASLRDPLAFFSRLRDVLRVTHHELVDNVAEYVEAWGPDSSTTEEDCKPLASERKPAARQLSQEQEVMCEV